MDVRYLSRGVSDLSSSPIYLFKDILRWGVWLGRHICEIIAQVS
jgi:hypothetical protein